jgi:ribA/ribD-fused uncharacterized protein
MSSANNGGGRRSVIISEFTGRFQFLSNFYASDIKAADGYYLTAEHLYQALKCKHREDREKIRKCPSPGMAKRLGQRVEIIDDWDRVKVDHMIAILMLKFNQNPDLRDQLIETGTAAMQTDHPDRDTLAREPRRPIFVDGVAFRFT